VDPLEFLARVVVHIPDKGHVTTRYYGWYANRPRGIPFRHARQGGDRGSGRAARDRPRATTRADRGQPPMGEGPTAALLQQSFEVDPLACPTCRGPMRIIACITQAAVIDQILAHRRTRAATATHAAARSPPSTRGPSGSGPTRRPAAAHEARCASPRRPAHVKGRSACASVPPGRPIGPRGDRAPTETAVQAATEARRRAEIRPLRAGRPSRGPRSRRTFTGYSTKPD